MGILRDKTINTSKVSASDKVIKNILGSSISVQIDGGAKLAMKGSHANFESDNFYTIAMINMSTLNKVAEAAEPGLYLAVVEGIDEIQLEISGEGIIHWKELGD